MEFAVVHANAVDKRLLRENAVSVQWTGPIAADGQIASDEKFLVEGPWRVCRPRFARAK
jgi:hypothetical protein